LAFVTIKRAMRRTWIDALLIVLVGAAIFAPVSTAYFCGYDDFGETHRAIFTDAQHPSVIFTTTHFGTTKYRPLNRLSTYFCWMLGRGSALPFRLRNLSFHLICALTVYALALLLTRERVVALISGLFFCLEPVANQTVVAAIFTNTTAYACLLVGLLAFLLWRQSRRNAWLALSLALVLVGMFFYEPVIVVFAMMAGYLLLELWRGNSPSRKEALTWLAGSAGAVFVFGVVRHLVVRGENPPVPLGTILHNAVLYAGGLLSPVDVVTANQLFGFPLPPALHLGRKAFLILLGAVGAGAAGLFAYCRTAAVRASLQRLDKGLILFLLMLIPVVLSPFLLFTPHASETYLYLPAALYAIFLSYLLWGLLPSKPLYWSVVALFLVSFTVGTWIRNQRVVACGQIADTILTSLPTAEWRTGDWSIHLFSAPSETPPARYGIYNYRGLSTIDPGDADTGNGAQNALQLITGNPNLKAGLVDPGKTNPSCITPDKCFEVFLNGSVRQEKSVLSPN